MESFDDFDDALARVNDSDFGLQAGVFTGRLAHAMRAWDRLEVGGVVVGDVPSFRVDNMPYGGIKDSGLGREGVRYAIERSEEHTSELQSLMRTSYAVFCWKKKNNHMTASPCLLPSYICSSLLSKHTTK